jgi:hypothetical protein
MRRIGRIGREAVALGGPLIFGLAVAGISWAQGSPTVLGCVNAAGKITAVDEPTGSCKPGETALSWYTASGANATFLRRTEKAADSDALDGLDSTQFLRDGAAAGGALAGTYPGPSIAQGAVGTAELQDGAVTAAKLAPGIPLGGSFGDSVRSETLTYHCGDLLPLTLVSMPIFVPSPSRIYASGSLDWDPGTTEFRTIIVDVRLRDVAATNVASTPLRGIERVDLPNSGIATSSGVLIGSGSTHAFVAAPGAYVLNLDPSLPGGCAEGDEGHLTGSLTYVLLRSAP